MNSGAAPIEAEVETIVQALHMVGSHHGIALSQAKRMNQFRQSTAEETKFMENDEDLDGHQASMPPVLPE